MNENGASHTAAVRQRRSELKRQAVEEAETLYQVKTGLDRVVAEQDRRRKKLKVNDPVMQRSSHAEDNFRRELGALLGGRQIPVSFINARFARCELCATVVNLGPYNYDPHCMVRHVRSWHAIHDCSGTWAPFAKHDKSRNDSRKWFSKDDLAFLVAQVQCIWCGVFMNDDEVASHFLKYHTNEVILPKCSLCFNEVILNARLREKFGEGIQCYIRAETEFQCAICAQGVHSLLELEEHINEAHSDLFDTATGNPNVMICPDAPKPSFEKFRHGRGRRIKRAPGTVKAEAIASPLVNSRMIMTKKGRRQRPLMLPSINQAIPANSPYVEASPNDPGKY